MAIEEVAPATTQGANSQSSVGAEASHLIGRRAAAPITNVKQGAVHAAGQREGDAGAVNPPRNAGGCAQGVGLHVA